MFSKIAIPELLPEIHAASIQISKVVVPARATVSDGVLGRVKKLVLFPRRISSSAS